MKLVIDGCECLIDDEDLPVVATGMLPWHVTKPKKGNTRYVIRRAEPSVPRQSLHAVVLGVGPDVLVDHINRNGLDNRKENLRRCTHAENTRNRGVASHNRSGFKGVYLVDRLKRKKCWAAIIQAHGIKHRLGTFARPEDAAMAYDEAARRLHGQFATTNEDLGLFG